MKKIFREFDSHKVEFGYVISEEEKLKYPIPNKEGEYYKHRMDMTTIKHFKERDFMEALSYIGVLPN